MSSKLYIKKPLSNHIYDLIPKIPRIVFFLNLSYSGFFLMYKFEIRPWSHKQKYTLTEFMTMKYFTDLVFCQVSSNKSGKITVP